MLVLDKQADALVFDQYAQWSLKSSRRNQDQPALTKKLNQMLDNFKIINGFTNGFHNIINLNVLIQLKDLY